jgi:dihydrofolate reductase
MMQHTKCSVFIATSLDGFISRPDGSIDWLNQANTVVPPGEDCGYARFMTTVDGLVMGRNTFEQVLTFGQWPYGALPVVVLSRRLGALPAGVPGSVSISAEPPARLVERLSARELNHLYVDGGLAIQSFLAAGLIDEITITLIPVLLGRGKPLFGPSAADVQLELLSSKAYDFSFVQNKYRVIKNA